MSTLKRLFATSATTLGTGAETTPPAGKVWNIPRLYICNTSNSDDLISVTINTGADTVYLVNNATLAAHDTLILENVVLIPGDTIAVNSGGPYMIHCYGAVIEEDE